jgi:1-acyl-sn-glycerol-3-phosphate acyltransferase
VLPNRPPNTALTHWLVWLWAWVVMRLTVVAALRVRVDGLDKVPRQGGAMMLANHTTLFDVLLCFWGVHRPTFGIGSEQVFRLPVVGSFLKSVGGIPYAKGAKDGAAVRALAEAYKDGGLIGMFPEGLRSWTGEPLPIRPGTGRLVKSLGCPVVYCRVYTGFLQHPRWATWPRAVPWHMEYDYEEFPEDTSAEDINRAIARSLAIDPAQIELPEGSWGYRLAEGLPEYLWACPSCFEMEALSVPSSDKDCVECGGCHRRWRVDLRTFLNGETPETPTWTVGQARERVDERFTADTPVECDWMDVTQVRRGQLKAAPVASGRARLGTQGVEIIQDDQVLWTLSYAEMRAVLLQFRNALQVRTEDSNYQLTPRGQSTLRWHHFLALRADALVG